MIEPIPAYLNNLSSIAIGSACEVHSIDGPGLSEKAYELCLIDELERRGIKAKRQVILPVKYKGSTMKAFYRIDVLIENCLIVEVKIADTLTPLHRDQLLSYLKQSGCRLGLLMNFNSLHMIDGIMRVAL